MRENFEIYYILCNGLIIELEKNQIMQHAFSSRKDMKSSPLCRSRIDLNNIDLNEVQIRKSIFEQSSEPRLEASEDAVVVLPDKHLLNNTRLYSK